jgi:hypothetical protein
MLQSTQGPPSSQQPNIDIKQTTETLCEKCEGDAFQESVILRGVSALMSGTGKAGFLPIQVFACAACGHVNEGFKPAELRSAIIVP